MDGPDVDYDTQYDQCDARHRVHRATRCERIGPTGLEGKRGNSFREDKKQEDPVYLWMIVCSKHVPLHQPMHVPHRHQGHKSTPPKGRVGSASTSAPVDEGNQGPVKLVKGPGDWTLWSRKASVTKVKHTPS